jgi:hypothetical protein
VIIAPETEVAALEDVNKETPLNEGDESSPEKREGNAVLETEVVAPEDLSKETALSEEGESSLEKGEVNTVLEVEIAAPEDLIKETALGEEGESPREEGEVNSIAEADVVALEDIMKEPALSEEGESPREEGEVNSIAEADVVALEDVSKETGLGEEEESHSPRNEIGMPLEDVIGTAIATVIDAIVPECERTQIVEVDTLHECMESAGEVEANVDEVASPLAESVDETVDSARLHDVESAGEVETDNVHLSSFETLDMESGGDAGNDNAGGSVFETLDMELDGEVEADSPLVSTFDARDMESADTDELGFELERSTAESFGSAKAVNGSKSDGGSRGLGSDSETFRDRRGEFSLSREDLMTEGDEETYKLSDD